MCDFDWPLQVFDIGSAILCHQTIDLDTSVQVCDARKTQYHARECREAVRFNILKQVVKHSTDWTMHLLAQDQRRPHVTKRRKLLPTRRVS